MANLASVLKTIDHMKDFTRAIDMLNGTRVMVGIPAEKTDRKEEGAITNAAIGYINEHGAPEVGIPPRPHMVPGVLSVQAEVTKRMEQVGELALDGKPEAMKRAYNAMGALAANAIKKKITDGLQPPLKPATITARIRRHKNRVDTNPKPLIDTSQYRRAITWVVRQAFKKP